MLHNVVVAVGCLCPQSMPLAMLTMERIFAFNILVNLFLCMHMVLFQPK